MILFTLDTDTDRAHYLKTAVVYLFATIFFAMFGAIYESFSHGVYSFYMVYSFLVPLLGGTTLFLCLAFSKKNVSATPFGLAFYHCALSTFTVGSIVCGVLEIYGTDNSLIYLYPVFGLTLLFLSVALYFKDRKNN